MPLDTAKNFAKVTVSTGYDASATSIVLTGGHGAKLPAAPFNATWWNSTDYADPSDDPNVEIVRVTAIATDTLTVTRGQESISATTKNTGGKTYKMVAGLTAKAINTDLLPASRPHTLQVWGALSNEPTASLFPVLSTRNGHPVLLYDDTTDESGIFRGIFPRRWANAGVTVCAHVSLTSATANNIKFEAAFERIGFAVQDLDSDGFGTPQNSGDVAVPGTSGHVVLVSIPFTLAQLPSSIAIGEQFRLKLTSKVPAGTKATGDRELTLVELRDA